MLASGWHLVPEELEGLRELLEELGEILLPGLRHIINSHMAGMASTCPMNHNEWRAVDKNLNPRDLEHEKLEGSTLSDAHVPEA